MTSADFYVGLGEDAEWLGSVSVDGSAADMDDQELFGNSEVRTYSEATFRETVAKILEAAVEQDRGYSAAAGDVWPWPYPDSGQTDAAYVFKNGTIHVFERGADETEGLTGQFLFALHYPNGARKPTYFPKMTKDS